MRGANSVDCKRRHAAESMAQFVLRRVSYKTGSSFNTCIWLKTYWCVTFAECRYIAISYSALAYVYFYYLCCRFSVLCSSPQTGVCCLQVRHVSSRLAVCLGSTRRGTQKHGTIIYYFYFNFHSCDLYQYVTVVALAYFRLTAFTELCGS